MKFSHIADCHIGGWRDPKLKVLNSLAFEKAVNLSIEQKVDFILIAGDLFNSALPGIDKLKEVIILFKKLKNLNIPVYLIAGSHDFSPSGKTMLDVIEEADLCINVVKGQVDEESKKLKLNFTIDPKTGAKITGMLGRRGMLEKSYYEELDRTNLENEEGFKIFMFHTALTELKPKSLENMESSPISLLPKNFDYYAGGHVHIVEKMDLVGYKNVVYPGPLFPNSFHELEELLGGGFYIYDNGQIIRQEIMVKPIKKVSFNVKGKDPESVTGEIISELEKIELDDALILLRIKGELDTGKITQIDFRKIYEFVYSKNAYFIMRNTSSLSSKEYEEIKIQTKSSRIVEEELINEHVGQIKVDEWDEGIEKSMIKTLMRSLSTNKVDGEKVYEFEDRIKKEINHILEL
jgi:DNA repair protein SbcD/Mre11